MKTIYHVIGFGENERGLINQSAKCDTIGYACGIYNAHLQDPEMDGAVIIRDRDESWEVIQEFSAYPIEIVYTAHGKIMVERAKKLVMV